MKKKDKYPDVEPVIVRWVDSTGSTGWRDYVQNKMECTSVGILIKKTKDRVAIAQNRSHHGDGEFMEIPMCAVKSIKKLKQ